MESKLPPGELADLINRSGYKHAEARQVAKRLKALLPQRLKQIEAEYRCQHPPGKALRLALADPRYIAFLNKAADIQAAAIGDRITWETHRMLFEARRSIEAFERNLMCQRS